jgi:hypothetical protein
MANTSTNNLLRQSLSSATERVEIWPLGIDHSTSKLEKSERARRRNENDNRLLAEFASLVLAYCEGSKMDEAQCAEFSHDILGFLHDK